MSGARERAIHISSPTKKMKVFKSIWEIHQPALNNLKIFLINN
mgnify:CR=1 FL=1